MVSTFYNHYSDYYLVLKMICKHLQGDKSTNIGFENTYNLCCLN